MNYKTTFFKKIYFLLLLCLSIIIYSCSQENEPTPTEKTYLQKNRELKVAVFPYYAPYQFINQQGEIDGIFIDFMKIIEQKNNIKFKKIYYKNWADLVKGIKNDKIDIVLEIQKTPERSKYLNFFEPLFKSQIVLVQRKKTKKINGLENFGNKKMILPNNYATVEFIQTKFPKINISFETNDENCLKKMNDGLYDAFIGPKAVINYFIKKDKLRNIEITGDIDDIYMPSFATKKKNNVLTSIVEKSLQSISSAQKKEIVDNWLFDQVTPVYEKSNFWIIVAAFIFSLSIFFGIINYYLKQKVKQKTIELNLAKIKAEESNQFKTTLIHNISHEIRTPMNGIIGFTELLKNNALTDETKTNYIEIITKSTKDLEEAVNSILDISQLETKEVTVNKEFIDILSLTEELRLKFSTPAELKKIQLKINNDESEKDLLVEIDRKKLSKIISCLLENAIKFTKKGQITIHITLQQNYLKIALEDTGIGIDDIEKELIFNSFYQSQKSLNTNSGGLGLGLYFAKKYSSLLNGKISFDSTINEGSKFTVMFSEINTKSKEVSSPIKIKNTEKTDEKFNVLIAEDGDINYLLLQKLLSKIINHQFNIYRALDGQEAVELSQKNNYDLILMDIKMPRVDGYEATKIIKRSSPKLKIIAQTAFSRDEDIKKAYEAGCDDFIAKPINFQALNAILDKHLIN